ncbi:MAG: hypothetical protein WCV99_04305 [Sterolibacterium sp.]
MTTANISVGRQLLGAMVSNSEPDLIRVLDAACLQIRGRGLDADAEIDRVIDQLREAEIALGLEHDSASRKMVRSAMNERLVPRKDALLAA